MTVHVGQHCAPSISVFMPLLCLVTFWCQSACKDSLFALIVVIWLRFARFENSHNWNLHFLFMASLCLCVHVWSIWFVLRSKVVSGKEWTHSLPTLWIAATYHPGAFPQYHHLLFVLQLLFHLQSLLLCIHSNLCSGRGGGSCIHSFLNMIIVNTLVNVMIISMTHCCCPAVLLRKFCENTVHTGPETFWAVKGIFSYWSRNVLRSERNFLCKMVSLYICFFSWWMEEGKEIETCRIIPLYRIWLTCAQRGKVSLSSTREIWSGSRQIVPTEWEKVPT